MVNNEVLKARVAPKLKELQLSEDEMERLIRELNYLSDLLIDNYLAMKAAKNDKSKAN